MQTLEQALQAQLGALTFQVAVSAVSLQAQQEQSQKLYEALEKFAHDGKIKPEEVPDAGWQDWYRRRHPAPASPPATTDELIERAEMDLHELKTQRAEEVAQAAAVAQ